MSWLLSLSERSRIVELGFPLTDTMPRVANVPPLVVATGAAHQDGSLPDGTAGCNELVLLGTHMGTHLDGLSHVSFKGRVFGGQPVDEVQGRSGVRELDMTTVDPFVCPGVLLDVARNRHVDILEAPLELGVPDLMPLAAFELSGSVVLIRTGWGRFWTSDPARYASLDLGRPGLSAAAARWLAERGVRAVGTDSFTIEAWHPRDAGPPAMPAHRELLVERGVHVFEALDLEALSGVLGSPPGPAGQPFLFVALPLRLQGGSGSPVRPIAIIA